MKARLYQLWDKLSLYLPIVLMSQFALGTWWLVRNTPKLDEQGSPRQVRHESDYQLRKFSIQAFDAEGQFKSQIWGTQALHYPDTDTLDIESVRLHAIDARGMRTHGTAQQASTRDNGTQVELRGQVHLVRESASAAQTTPPMVFESEMLAIDSNQHRLSTTTPVQITQGGRQFSANSMDYRHEQGQLELRGQVRGTLPAVRH